MNVEDLTLKQIRELTSMFGQSHDNGMIGRYVIVRCKDAGVHAGYLESSNGRSCVLTQSRRLWYWKCADDQSFLSGVASAGLHPDSKVGAMLQRIELTENCEIILVHSGAIESIKGAPAYVKK